MLPLRDEDRVRILAAVARKGAVWSVRRVVVITLSLLLLLAVPALGIARVDLWGGRHVLLGAPVGIVQGLQGLVITLAVLYGVTFLSNVVVGRFFCGWGCPVGHVSRLGEDVDLERRSRRRKLVAHVLGAGFVATFVGAVMSWWVDPRVLPEGSWAARGVVLGVFAVLCAGGFLHAFVWRFGFCLHACPIGLYYRYVTSRTPVGIVFSEVPDPCTQCGACTKICPVDLDPRQLGVPTGRQAPHGHDGGPAEERYGDAECLRCGDCVEACRMVFSIRPAATPPLRFGRAGGSAPPPPGAVGPADGPAPAKLDAGASPQFHGVCAGEGPATVEDSPR